MSVQSIATSDFGVLTELKAQAAQDAKGALPEVAKQFEGIFLQLMLKSMPMGEHFLDESSPFRGKERETFQEMLDAQYASNIAGSRGIGLSTMLAKKMESISETEVNVQSMSIDKLAPASADLQLIKDATKKPSVMSVDDFVKSVWPKAKAAASLIGLDPKILMAQVALETGWGKFITKDADGTSSNNLFNIKTGNHSEYDSVTVQTTEYIADTPIKMNASFRKYLSVADSFNDYISLIKSNERYQGALASSANPENYLYELHKAGYATDPEYSAKILSIYHGDELNQALQKWDLPETNSINRVV